MSALLDAVGEPDDPRIDTVLDDRFRIVARLGAGGMGVVYRAVQLSVGREVALKIMTRRPNDMANERFLREACLASQLSHPAIVTTFDCGRTSSGELWIAMELLHGRTLREVLEHDGALPLDRALAIAEQIAGALASAHDTGIVHRDIKPSNVMVLDDGRAKLLDFGLACSQRSSEESITRSGIVCGTPAYLAPEVALGCAAGPRSDLYGLGLVLHEMLAGAHPFAALTPEAQVSRALNEAPPRLAGVPARVAGVVLRLLARAPDERCPSAGVAREWLGALRSGARNVRLPRPPRRTRSIAIAIAAIVVAAGAASAAVAYRSPPRALMFRGGYTSSGNENCTHGTSWLRIEGDRIVGAALSDQGQSFEVIGTYRPGGAVYGAFTLRQHALGSFEGIVQDGHMRGTTIDYVYNCTGTFDLTLEP